MCLYMYTHIHRMLVYSEMEVFSNYISFSNTEWICNVSTDGM